MKVGLLGYRSTQIVAKQLNALEHGDSVISELYVTDHGQVESAIYNANSDLFSFQPHAIVIIQSYRHLYERFYQLGMEEKSAFSQTLIREITGLYEQIKKSPGCPVLISNLEERPDGLYGSHGNKLTVSLTHQLRRVNLALSELAHKEPDLYILDVCNLAAEKGFANIYDGPLDVNADIPFKLDFERTIADEILRSLKALRGQSRKCLILDLDNTIWGGEIAESGLKGIQLGGQGIGRSYQDLQKWIKELKSRGILLAVCSANDKEVAQLPFTEHPEMILTLDDIAVFKAGWEDKASMILSIREQLNIALNSMVFLDDSPMERELVRSILPEIEVPELPRDPSTVPYYLKSLRLFDLRGMTAEDSRRTETYRQENQRQEFKGQFRDLSAFMQSLEMKADIQPFLDVDHDRLSQLSLRTNQCNLDARRYSADDIASMAADGQFLCYALRLKDRFGDYGLVSFVVLQKENELDLSLISWCMSCRVMKRGVEDHFMNFITREAQKLGYHRVLIDKGITRNWIGVSELGFQDENAHWILDMNSYEPLKTWIEDTV